MSINIKTEKILQILSQNKQKWLHLSLQHKINYLEQIQDNLLINAKQWAENCCKAKEGNLDSNIIGQELLAGPAIVMRQIKYYLKALKYNGKPPLLSVKIKDKEQISVKVMPENLKEKILWKGFSAEVLLEKNKPLLQGESIKKGNKYGELSLILGAGNVSSIAPLDILYKLFFEGNICIVKLNPVNEYLFEVFNKVFINLVKDGFLAFTKGGEELGEFLCNHSLVDNIHITGSHVTHDKIVWGNGTAEEIQKKKLSYQVKCNKKITSELGCVTPFIIVPGVWTDDELIYHAKQIASAVTNNASFNCNAAKLLVTCQGWQQRDLFLKYLKDEFSKAKARKAYYPGAWQRYTSFLQHYPQAEIIGENNPNCIPWTFIPNISNHDFALNHEAFCGILCEISLPARNIPEFMQKSVEFCNEKVWGTLSCTIIIDSLTEKIFASELDFALQNLQYGGIAVNCWSALVYALCSTTWGAFPNSTIENIKSGIGVVHNGYFLENVEKSIVRAPFKINPTPPWFHDNKNTEKIGYALLDYEYNESFLNFSKLILAAFKG